MFLRSFFSVSVLAFGSYQLPVYGLDLPDVAAVAEMEATADLGEAFVGDFLLQQGWDTAHPYFQPMVRTLRSRVTVNDESGHLQWDEKYYGFAVENIQRVNRIADAVAALGPDYQRSWQRWAASRIIMYRIAYDWAALDALLGSLPTGEVVSCESLTAFEQELQQRYEWNTLSTADKLRYAANLVAINPDLSQRGGKAVRLEAPDQRWQVATENNWVATIDLASEAQILFPESKEWLSTDHGHFLDVPRFRVNTPQLQHYYVTLDAAGLGESDIVLRFDVLDGEVISGVATAPGLNNRQYPLLPLRDNDRYGREHMVGGRFPEAWLTFHQNNGQINISGGARILLAWGKREKRSQSLNLNLTITPNDTSGSYVSRRYISRKEPLRLSEGLVSAAAAPQGRQEIAEKSQWRSPFGNDGRGVVAAGEAWVDDPEYAALAWVTDATIPVGRGPNTRGSARSVDRGLPLSGGWSSPIVADEKVFINYFRPSGDRYAYNVQLTGNPEQDVQMDMMRISTDEYLRAFDLRTGATVWETQFHDRGVNWMAFNKAGPGTTAAVSGGTAIWLGTTGEVYAVDAVTGEPLWLSHIGLRHELMNELKRQCLQDGTLYNSRNDFQSMVTIIGDVVVVPDHMLTKTDYRYETANGLIGLDLKTGAVRWHLPEVCGNSRFLQTAQVWRHQGREYLIASERTRTHIIDPRQGDILATQENLTNRHWGFMMNEDILVGDWFDPAKPGSESRSAGWRIDPEQGFQHLWTLPDRYRVRQGGGVAIGSKFYLQSHATPNGFHGIACIDAETGRVLAEAPCAVGGGEHSPFLIATENGQLIAATDRTRGLIFLNADPDKMADSVRYWELSMSTGYCGSVVPALVDDLLIVRAPDRLLAYDLRQSVAPERPFAEHWPHSPRARERARLEREQEAQAKSKQPQKKTDAKKKSDTKKNSPQKPKKKPAPAKPDLEGLLNDEPESSVLDDFGLN